MKNYRRRYNRRSTKSNIEDLQNIIEDLKKAPKDIQEIIEGKMDPSHL